MIDWPILEVIEKTLKLSLSSFTFSDRPFYQHVWFSINNGARRQNSQLFVSILRRKKWEENENETFDFVSSFNWIGRCPSTNTRQSLPCKWRHDESHSFGPSNWLWKLLEMQPWQCYHNEVPKKSTLEWCYQDLRLSWSCKVRKKHRHAMAATTETSTNATTETQHPSIKTNSWTPRLLELPSCWRSRTSCLLPIPS